MCILKSAIYLRNMKKPNFILVCLSSSPSLGEIVKTEPLEHNTCKTFRKVDSKYGLQTNYFFSCKAGKSQDPIVYGANNISADQVSCKT